MKHSDPILIITSNPSKIKEISTILGEYGIETDPRQLDIPEYRFDLLEDVSRSKAEHAFAEFQKPLLVDDTGIFFEVYDEFPGVVTKFIFQKIGLEGLLKLIEDKDNRKAYYKSCITYIDEPGKPITFSGEFHGKIPSKPSDQLDTHFPYDSIFVPKGERIPRIELEYKDRIKGSHRRKALIKFKDWYLGY